MDRINKAIGRLFVPREHALETLRTRRRDSILLGKVTDRLDGDLPKWVGGEVAYFSRHVASPNHETIAMVKDFSALGFEVVIGQDSGDKFTSVNHMKRALGSIHVLVDVAEVGGVRKEIFRKYKIVDFDAVNGKRIEDVKTLWGQSLMQFHNELFSEIVTDRVRLVDDAKWISRRGRSDIKRHYADQFSLYAAHAVMVEGYFTHVREEAEFVEKLVLPTFESVAQEFGVLPLIANLYPYRRSDEYWFGYPPEVEVVLRSLLNK
ncbi:hypothetical protein [Paucibacter soli]|uniref:hypothetical protein n=1 Tax=Paucibacter soli TaxID=3133433 RepID=UPI00309874E8